MKKYKLEVADDTALVLDTEVKLCLLETDYGRIRDRKLQMNVEEDDEIYGRRPGWKLN